VISPGVPAFAVFLAAFRTRGGLFCRALQDLPHLPPGPAAISMSALGQ
jgi:hypothetical protein